MATLLRCSQFIIFLLFQKLFRLFRQTWIRNQLISMFCFRKAIIIFSVLIVSDQMKLDEAIYGRNDCNGCYSSNTADRLKHFQSLWVLITFDEFEYENGNFLFLFISSVKNHLKTAVIPKDSASIRYYSLAKLPKTAEKFVAFCLGTFEKEWVPIKFPSISIHD